MRERFCSRDGPSNRTGCAVEPQIRLCTGRTPGWQRQDGRARIVALMTLRAVWTALLGVLISSNSAFAGTLEIRVQPKRVFQGQRYRLSLEGAGERVAGSLSSRVLWSATAGRLITARGASVVWEAPRDVSTANVAVRVAEAGREAAASLSIEVLAASRESMVFVPAGPFVMGDTWTDTEDPRYFPTDQNKHDRPFHWVDVDAFWIDRFKVTNRRSAAFLNEAKEEGLVRANEFVVLGDFDGSTFPFYRFKNEQPPEQPVDVPVLEGELSMSGGRFVVKSGCEEHPIVDVTWAGAVAFARYYGKRLPTEAEWEKAGRGTDSRRYPWGDDVPTRFHANLNGYFDGPTPVGMFSPLGDSPYGVADVLGGCHEWVQDWFNHDLFRDRGRDERTIRNPTGPDWGYDHAFRGRSRLDSVTGSHRERSPLSFRYSWDFEYSFIEGFAHAHTGFRTALSP